MKILVIGGDSFLGKNLMFALAKDYNVICSHHKAISRNDVEIDLTKRLDILPKLKKIRPDIVVIASALNNIDLCEKEKERAWETNVKSLEPMIEYCKVQEKKLVFLSSCAVFDGEHPPYKKNDLTSPISFYGVTKLIGENMIRRDLDNFIIIRSDAFYGYNNDRDRITFPIEVIKTLKMGKKLDVDNERHIYPTLIDDLALMIKLLISHDRVGIFQITSDDQQTHFSFAQEIAEVFQLDKSLLKEKKRDYFLRPKDGEMKIDIHTSSVKEGLILMRKQMEDSGSRYI